MPRDWKGWVIEETELTVVVAVLERPLGELAGARQDALIEVFGEGRYNAAEAEDAILWELVGSAEATRLAEALRAAAFDVELDTAYRYRGYHPEKYAERAFIDTLQTLRWNRIGAEPDPLFTEMMAAGVPVLKKKQP